MAARINSDVKEIKGDVGYVPNRDELHLNAPRVEASIAQLSMEASVMHDHLRLASENANSATEAARKSIDKLGKLQESNDQLSRDIQESDHKLLLKMVGAVSAALFLVGIAWNRSR